MHTLDITIVIIFLVTIISITVILLLNSLDTQNIDKRVSEILNKEDENESFTVSDAQDFHNYDKLRDQVLEMPNNFNKSRIINPPKSQGVDYEDNKETKDNPNIKINTLVDKEKLEEKKNSEENKCLKPRDSYDDSICNTCIPDTCRKKGEKDDNFTMMVVHGEPKPVPIKKHPRNYVCRSDYGWETPFPTVSCANSSIDSRFKTGPKKIIPGHIACGSPDGLTAENYYRTHFEAPIARLEDYRVKGWNYMDFSSAPHPTKSNIRILSQNTKGLPPKETEYRNVPTAANYAFHNTPALSMP